MNCKPGDLAVIVASKTGNAGLIVEVLRPASFEVARLPENGFLYEAGGPAWVIKSMGTLLKHMHKKASPWACVMDSSLRPIRPQPDDAVDEVIQRIGTPHKEVA